MEALKDGRNRPTVGIGRRDLLAGMATGALSAALPAAAHSHGDACVVLWMAGGPSAIDTWDPKPGTRNGGPFRAIPTTVPGLAVSQHMPRLAETAHLLRVCRGVCMPECNHQRAMRRVRMDPRCAAPSIDALRGAYPRAFDVDEEPAAVRRAYGSDGFGRQCLIARRLVEAGVTRVQVRLEGWDTHTDNFERTRRLLNVLDPATATLVRELDERGLLRRTRVVWLGEFGRTHEVNRTDGRDHCAEASVVVLAGRGVRAGTVVGGTDQEGRPLSRAGLTLDDALDFSA